MAEPFVGQLKAFGFTYAPRGWARCDGSLLAISQNDALFSLLGTMYGGDGRTTFGLPDLRGRVSLHTGTGPGLTPRRMGQKGGAEQVTLNVTQLPSHRHTVSGDSSEANSVSPANRVPATAASAIYQSTPDAPMNANMLGQTGGTRPHNNMEPYLVINWCIALVGIYPSRS